MDATVVINIFEIHFKFASNSVVAFATYPLLFIDQCVRSFVTRS
jgi:hypothetical protein